MKMIIIILGIFCLITKLSLNQETATSELIPKRSNVVFILGEDQNIENPYYDLAKRYYLLQKDFILVDTCRSLVAVRDYLEESHQEDVPYGKIEIVVHSNPWTGVSVPVFEDDHRAEVGNLTNAMVDGSFLPLSDKLVDSMTQINLQACGLGHNEAFLEAFKHAIGGFDGQLPKVTASKQFIQYKEDDQQRMVKKHLKSWYGFYKTGYRPGHIRLSRQFKKRYPDAQINWRSALERTRPLLHGEAYHYTMNVPLDWKVFFNGHTEMPELKKDQDILDFVMEQEDLMEVIGKLEIPAEKFRWKVKRVIDVERPYIKLIGKTSIVCILKDAASI